MKVLGVKIDNFSKKETLRKVEDFLSENKIHQIVTVNPEFILRAQEDEEFKNILNDADLSIADGAGIWFAFLRHLKYLKTRITGIDLMLEILRLAENKNLPVFLVSHKNALSSWEETRDAILKTHPDLKIDGDLVGTECPFGCQSSKSIGDWAIVFCNFGAPHQERFIHSLKSLGQSKIRVAMGVGGGFDFLTGNRRRAPKILRKIGLEWLWRFVGEPKRRAGRIWNAVVIFPIRVLLNK